MDPFIGEIRMMGCDYAPRNWAFCNGGLIPIAQNPTLYAIIGDRYGGDYRSNMALPNLAHRVPIGQGRGPGLTLWQQGEFGGVDSVSLGAEHLPAHTHEVNGLVALGDNSVPSNTEGLALDTALSAPRDLNFLNSDDSLILDTEMASHQLSYTGQSQAHENRQPLLALNFVIALLGAYPSRN